MQKNYSLFAFLLLVFIFSAQTALAQCASAANIVTVITNGKKYQVVKENKTWASAASCAVSLGGYLVEINSQAEQDSVYHAITSVANVASNYTTVSDGGGIAYVWIGASDVNTEGTWIWNGDGATTGTTFFTGQGSAGTNNGAVVNSLYNNWGGTSAGPTTKEPDNFSNNQDAAAIALAGWPAFNPGFLGVANEWNDINATNSIYFVVEFDCSKSSSSVTDSACGSYTVPSGDETYNSSGVYMDTVLNSNGCDSVLTITLTITNLDTNVSQNSVLLSANDSTASSYQWLDCNNGFAMITGATSKSYTATSNGSYAVILNKNNCSDTSACKTVNDVSLAKAISLTQAQLFPNPTNGSFTLNLGTPLHHFHIRVKTLNGQTLSQQYVDKGQQVPLKLNQPAGLYLLEVVKDNQTLHTLKLLIN